MGILGESMGAFGAISAAQLRPDLFDKVCASGPALWRSAADQAASVPDAFEGPADFAARDPFARIAALRGVDVRIVCGTSDPFYDAARAFAAALQHDRIAVETVWLEHGCHDEETWLRATLGDLAFVS